MGEDKDKSPFSVKVDFGIAEILRVFAEIWKRRRARKGQAFAKLRYDLDLADELVKRLDGIFIALINGFTRDRIIHSPKLLQSHVEATKKYLFEREIYPKLTRVITEIKSAAANRRLKGAAYREFTASLRQLVTALRIYSDALGKGSITGVGQTNKWNLQTLCEKAERLNYGGGIVQLPIDEIARQVLANHNFSVSNSIYQLIGTASAQGHALDLFSEIGKKQE